MEMILLFVTFALGRIGLCAIHFSDRRLLAFESASTALFLAVASSWNYFAATQFDGALIAMLFVATAFLARWLARKDSGPRIGIIQFVWITILGITCGSIVFAQNFEVLQTGKIPGGMNPEYYAQVAAELNFLLGKSMDLTMVLGSILAVCMSILWSRDVWRQEDREGQKDYESTTRGAIAMSFAFFVVLIAVALWIWLPLYNNYALLKNLLRS